MKKYNFSAGPAILPQSVMKAAAAASINFNEMNLSILEISHRSPEFVAVMDEALALVKELLGLNDDFEVLFLSGGASSQFFMAAMNFLNEDESAAYVDTGAWSHKAIKEAHQFGNVNIVGSSESEGFVSVPKNYDIPADSKYLHLTSNNTIYGTQLHNWPETNVPIVCDMSSDIFSRPIDVSKFGMIYAGAQKNMGPAGTTLVVIRKDMLGKVTRAIPTMLNYQTHIDKGSMFNTPPVFPIFVSMLTLRWVKANGGVEGMAKRNEEKAKILYDEIDSNPSFRGVARKEDRSRMNVTFVLENPKQDDAFLKACIEAGCSGIKGHRSVGGFRASIYNAMTKEGVQVLVDVMKKF
jgi:phosphoserine aminotransferase